MDAKSAKGVAKRSRAKAGSAAAASTAKKSTSSSLTSVKTRKNAKTQTKHKIRDLTEEKIETSSEEESHESDLEEDDDDSSLNESLPIIKRAQTSAKLRRSAVTSELPSPPSRQSSTEANATISQSKISYGIFVLLILLLILGAVGFLQSSSSNPSHLHSTSQPFSDGCGRFNVSSLIATSGLSMSAQDPCAETLQRTIRSHSQSRALNMHVLAPKAAYTQMDTVIKTMSHQLNLPAWAVVRLLGNEKSATASTKLSAFLNQLLTFRSSLYDEGESTCYEGLVVIDTTQGLGPDVRALLEQPMDDSASIIRVEGQELSSKKLIFLFFQQEDNEETLRSLAVDHATRLSRRLCPSGSSRMSSINT